MVRDIFVIQKKEESELNMHIMGMNLVHIYIIFCLRSNSHTC